MWRLISIVALAITTAGLLIINVALQQHNHQLLSRIENLESSQGPPVGFSFTSISGTDLNNLPVRLDYAERTDRSLFLLLSPACRYTKENWPYWHRLLKEAPNTKVVFADITGEVDPNYFRAAGLASPGQVIKLDGSALFAHNLRVTPTTVVLGPRGCVEGVWTGVLDNEDVRAALVLLGASNNTRPKKENNQ